MKKTWRPHLVDDVLGLAYVVAEHFNEIQKITGVSLKNQFNRGFSRMVLIR